MFEQVGQPEMGCGLIESTGSDRRDQAYLTRSGNLDGHQASPIVEVALGEATTRWQVREREESELGRSVHETFPP
ncbi:hypothetical protein HCU01_36680 [Halomonas cupida]|uniref:Uncharacterized protein n=1 Tax=Halomonas cupida TaxID=44933 RepID=A0ABQ0WIX0_9GAMM|nr:hypothetical protein HCU01_36680 [Halomonas cupida]